MGMSFIKIRNQFWFLLLCIVCCRAVSYGAIRLPSIIGDNMVLQQNSQAPLWGWSNPNQDITVNCGWNAQNINCKADNAGRWRVNVSTPGYSGPHTITISTNDDSVSVVNVMVGEVWLCSGQSNMQCYVGPITWPGVFDYQQVIDDSANSNIRMFTVMSSSLSAEPLEDCSGDWKQSAPSSVGSFSAVAYFFAKELNSQLNVPVGVINTSLGGTRIETWTDEDSLRTLGYCDAELDSYNSGGVVLNVNSATVLYNSMIAPLIPYRIAGAIWYQGESNVNNSGQYESLFSAMVEGWRGKWQQGDFPFYFAQIAPFKYSCTDDCAAKLRQAQFNSLAVSNTGMIVTTDLVDNINDIHPRNKEDVGKRLSLWALSKSYAKNGIVCSGPLFKSLKAEVGSLRVSFDYAGGGLTARDGGLTHFEIAGQNMNFVDAAAVIQNDTVVVSSSRIPVPYAVRFGWANDAVGNLFNNEGLPASPFEASLPLASPDNSVALSQYDVFYYGDIKTGWAYSDPGNYHVTESANAVGITGYALSFTNSVFDSTNCSLTFSAGHSLNSGSRIPNNSTVYVSAWVKKTVNFAQTQSNTGPEIWLRLTSPHNNEDYRSNTAVSLRNSLTFGWSDPSSIAYSQISSSEWRYFEFPVQVGHSGCAGGWSGLSANVTSRAGWGGDLAAGFNGTIYFDNICVKINKDVPAEPVEFAVIENDDVQVRLAKDIHYALESVIINGVQFKSSLDFPSFVVRSSSGGYTLKPYDSNWQVAADVNDVASTAVVTYSRPEIEVVVKYQFTDYGVLISAEPVRETSYKLIGLNSGNAMMTVGSSQTGSADAFVLSPFGGGEIINFDPAGSSRNASHLQNWTFQAGFTGIGYGGRGLIVRSPQQGAIWSYGRQYIRDDYSLVCGFETFYRPQASAYSMPIADNKIEIQLAVVEDENTDGQFDWVDLGFLYSELFIKKNENLDKGFLNSVAGKIDVSAPPLNVLNYSQLLPQIEAIDFAPQTWWLVGAHTSPEKSYCDPPYSVSPDASHRGDYFAFKAACASAGARIGLHEMAQDITPQMPDWPVPVMLRSDGQPYVSGWSAYFKSIDDKGFFYFLNKHFKNWQVEEGDSWHWDVLTAEAPRENYDPEHVATYGSNFRDRVKLLKYVKDHGIHITSEGLQEQMAQYCDFAWHAVIAGNEMVGGTTGGQGEFESTMHVPLLPVLFLGKSYYAMAWPVAKNMLYGGRYVYEGTSINAAELQAGMMPQVNAWSSIANRRVTDIDYEGGVWTVKYSPEATLTANLSNNTWTLDIPQTCDTASHILQDINNDCVVDYRDFAILSDNWGMESF